MGIVPNLEHRATSNLKEPGNLLFIIGETRAELGGSLLYHHLDYAGGTVPGMPTDPLTRYRRIHQAIGQGLVKSCHDPSEGGLALALAEMAMAGRLGATITLDPNDFGHLSVTDILFAESNGRLLIEVHPDDADRLRELFDGLPLVELGLVTKDGNLTLLSKDETLVDLSIPDIVAAWKQPAHQQPAN